MNTLAKTYVYKFLTTLVIVNSIGCGNSQQDSRQGTKMDTASNQTLKNKTDMSRPDLGLHELTCKQDDKIRKNSSGTRGYHCRVFAGRYDLS
jgi:hypothetical protein